MILFRLRKWGTVGWHYVSVHSDEEDEDIHSIVASTIGGALAYSELHVQLQNEDGQWEDLD